MLQSGFVLVNLVLELYLHQGDLRVNTEMFVTPKIESNKYVGSKKVHRKLKFISVLGPKSF